ILAGEAGDGEGSEDLDASGFDQLAQPRAERSSGRELVLLTAAVDAGEVRGADGPGDRGGRIQVREVQQGVRGRVASAGDHDALADDTIAITAQYIGQRRRDAARREGLSFTGGEET